MILDGFQPSVRPFMLRGTTNHLPVETNKPGWKIDENVAYL
jgi:hypothetical protein